MIRSPSRPPSDTTAKPPVSVKRQADGALTVAGTGGRQVSVAASGSPSIGLALGGGGARGLAHVAMLEAFDELGLRPKVMAGTSIGAIFAAAYASGLSAKDIRAHTEEVLTGRFDLVRDLFSARARSLPSVRRFFGTPSALLSADTLLELILPSRVAYDFQQLTIPLKIVATDFYGLEMTVFTHGALRRAVAASMCLPAVFEPVIIDGRVLLDGGLTNPLPYDLLVGEADITVAIDVTGAPVAQSHRAHPSVTEALMGSAFIFERSIIREKLRVSQPDIYIEAGTSHFQLFDVLRVKEILAAAAPAKERLKVQISRILESETLPVHDHAVAPHRVVALTDDHAHPATAAPTEAAQSIRGGLMKRFKKRAAKAPAK